MHLHLFLAVAGEEYISNNLFGKHLTENISHGLEQIDLYNIKQILDK